MTVPATAAHPAQFSAPILAKLLEILPTFGLPVHDPFAGPGTRLANLCDHLGLAFTGTEIEAPFIVDTRVRQGDSTHPDTYPRPPYVVVTSPVYPNGMTDHFHAKDGSKRHTYRQGLADVLGFDRELHPNNMGRWGNAHRRSKRSEGIHWDIAQQCVRHWPTWCVVNVKDVVAADYRVDVVDRWATLLQESGYAIMVEHAIATPGQRNGANGQLRADHEVIIEATRV